MIPRALILFADEAFWVKAFSKAKGAAWKKVYWCYLESTVWKRRRNSILERDSHRCQICRLATATEVHHLTYERVAQEKPEDLVSVCDRCHDGEHGRNQRFWDSITGQTIIDQIESGQREKSLA